MARVSFDGRSDAKVKQGLAAYLDRTSGRFGASSASTECPMVPRWMQRERPRMLIAAI